MSSSERLRLPVMIAVWSLVHPAVAAAADTSSGPDAQGEDRPLEEMVVTGSRESYLVDQARGSLKSAASLIETPRSVTVISRQLIEEQAAPDLHTVFRNVAGLNQQNFNGDFNLRGFRINGSPADAAVLYDGLRGHPGTFTYRPSLANIDRVEVLKGPSSVLHGTLSPGGVVNLVSKRPAAQRRTEITATGGSFDRIGGSLDTTGSLDGRGALQYRLTADYVEHQSQKDFVDVEQLVVQPGFAWEPTAGTRVDLLLLYTERDAKGERRRGIPDIEGDFFALPDDFTYNEPDDINDVEIFSTEVLFEHRLSDTLQLNAAARYFSDESKQEYHEPRGAEPTFDAPVVNRSFRDQLRESEALQLQGSLSVEFVTGAVTHNVTVGGDWFNLETDDDFRRARGPDSGVPPLNVLNPVHDAPGKAAYNLVQNALRSSERTLFGAFVKDELTWGDRGQWHLVGGLRYDDFEDEGEDLLRGISTADSDSAVSLSGGLLYELSEDLSVYASYSEGFVPQDLGDQIEPDTGGPFEPETAWQVETGAKRRWLDGRLQTTASVFFIEKENFLVRDPTDPSGDRLLELGSVESTGLEIEGFGMLTDVWSLTFNLSFQDPEIARTSPLEVLQEGDPPERGTPEESGAFWLRYDPPGPGFSAAFGPNYVGTRRNPASSGPGDNETIPSFVVWDAMLAYEHRSGAELRLNLNNLTDQDHYSGGGFGNRWGFQRGAPFNVMATVDYAF